MARWDIQPESSRSAVADARTQLEGISQVTPDLESAITGAGAATKSGAIAAALADLHELRLKPLVAETQSSGESVCDDVDGLIDTILSGDEQMRQEAVSALGTADEATGF
ncbi:DUF6507 family protein [Nesterenkonia halobia]|uniref:HEAT repeat domain-containing protein n=1 Tax=Nesterenkonia halobia TaxID=37922 RepID=A0ABP6RA49_9MICC